MNRNREHDERKRTPEGVFDWEQMAPEEVTELSRRKTALGENLTVARVELSRGATTHRHQHEGAKMIVVLLGSWRFTFPSREVTVRANQLLSIPAGLEHSSEALEDTVALDICGAGGRAHGEDRFLQRDPDQFLWGV